MTDQGNKQNIEGLRALEASLERFLRGEPDPADARASQAGAAPQSSAPEVTIGSARSEVAATGEDNAPEVTIQPARRAAPDGETGAAPDDQIDLAAALRSGAEADATAVAPAPAADPVRVAAADRPWPTATTKRLRVWPRRVRKVVTVAVPLIAVMLLGMVALWWRLMSGPIALDLATPWITAAIAENFGSGHSVAIGGTQLERDDTGRPRLRIVDIVVRDPDGTVVASAPKAEVGLSGTSLLTTRLRAERLSLVGAEMAVRIETDGTVTVFAGADKTRPIATAAPEAVRGVASGGAAQPATSPAVSPAVAPAARNALPNVDAMLGWIDGLGASGLDGHDLSELGLKNGSLVVDDRRTGKQWSLAKIDLSLNRTKAGGLGFSVSSDDPERPWRLKIGFTPAPAGHRVLAVEAEKVSLKDVLLALRLGEGQYEADIPISARLVAEIGADGIPQVIEGRIFADGGTVTQIQGEHPPLTIDSFESTLSWDRTRRSLVAPFQIVSGGNRVTLFAQLDAPAEGSNIWGARLTGGSVVLANARGNADGGAQNPAPSNAKARSATTAGNPQDQLVFNRLLLRLRIDPANHRIDVEQGEVGNTEFGIALSGGIDYSDPDPKLTIGLAGNRMPLATLKALWPVFINPAVRSWVVDHIQAATVDRVVIATNATLGSLRGGQGVVLPADGLSIEISASGATIAPVDGLPPLRDADMSVRVTGRTVSVGVRRSVMEASAGRKLVLSDGVFEVPDTAPDAPPAKVRFRLEGAVAAAAEILALPALRDASSGFALDPASSRGAINAQVTVGLTLNSDPAKTPMTYALGADVTNFAADRALLGQKLEAAALKVNATQAGYQAKGDVKLNGIPVSLDYRKQRSDPEAEVRIQANLDDNARNRLGFQAGQGIVGAVPLKMTGKIKNEQESRFAVDADLANVKIDNLLPGWVKPAGKPARVTFNLYRQGQSTRFDDVSIDGSGALVRGGVELDAAGEVLSANFPVFSLSDGDKTALKADRSPDGTLRVTMRGDVYDGRAFVKGMVAGGPVDKPASTQQQIKDLDLDIKIGTVAGHHGETIRGLELKMSRRAGALKSFNLSGKIGRDAALLGDLRGRPVTRQVLYIEAADAGALFRFTDTYARIQGGNMWVAMDPPGANPLAPQDGVLSVRNFSVRGEAALDRVASGGSSNRAGVEFTTTRVEFTKTPGKFVVRDGVVRGPIIGATLDGVLDYQANEVHMRGTFVPLYSLNNIFGQIPIVGLILGGGSNEGLVGITYEVIGTPSAPVLRVNPISAIAPGLLRKFFEFPTSQPQGFAEPSR